jgi:hypothetical protein
MVSHPSTENSTLAQPVTRLCSRCGGKFGGIFRCASCGRIAVIVFVVFLSLALLGLGCMYLTWTAPRNPLYWLGSLLGVPVILAFLGELASLGDPKKQAEFEQEIARSTGDLPSLLNLHWKTLTAHPRLHREISQRISSLLDEKLASPLYQSAALTSAFGGLSRESVDLLHAALLRRAAIVACDVDALHRLLQTAGETKSKTLVDAFLRSHARALSGNLAALRTAVEAARNVQSEFHRPLQQKFLAQATPRDCDLVLSWLDEPAACEQAISRLAAWAKMPSKLAPPALLRVKQALAKFVPENPVAAAAFSTSELREIKVRRATEETQAIVRRCVDSFREYRARYRYGDQIFDSARALFDEQSRLESEASAAYGILSQDAILNRLPQELLQDVAGLTDWSGFSSEALGAVDDFHHENAAVSTQRLRNLARAELNRRQ